LHHDQVVSPIPANVLPKSASLDILFVHKNVALLDPLLGELFAAPFDEPASNAATLKFGTYRQVM
jgi:hypothetical protein